MGQQNIQREVQPDELRLFTQKLLTDLRALQRMLDEDMFESGVRRIGAEQELFLVDNHGQPAPLADEILADLDDPHFTTELARFNLEFNLDPLNLDGGCLSRLEAQTEELLDKVRRVAAAHGVRVLLTGILPTLKKSDLSLDNMTPRPRYRALNDAILRLRGGEFEFRVRGTDELIIKHDSVMFESCNTSYQVHFQVGAAEFAKLYNVAQAVAAPVLAVATNSPLLFGKRLWRETRIALFQQSIDTRQVTTHLREQNPRVSFGRHWVDDSVVEIFREDIARLRVLLSAEVEEDPMAVLDQGLPPRLEALRLHNGTVYRWNRPCYGILDGKPHLRIENRVLPAGPTPLDEVANAAFWFGLMKAVSEEYEDITREMTFEAAEENFMAAARLGLHAQFTWPGYPSTPVQDLILHHLLPRARAGLDALEIDAADSERLLAVIEERVRKMRTGSQWMLDSLHHMAELRTTSTPKTRLLAALTMGALRHQERGTPVARWQLAELDETVEQREHYSQVQNIMITDLFTVNQDELVDLVAALMDWEHIRHVPVEDNQHRLVGLVTHRTLLRLMADGRVDPSKPIPVSEIMTPEPITVRPDISTLEAIRIMREKRIGCLPVTDDDHRLVGIITERDFLNMAGQLLEDFLTDSVHADD